MKHERGQAIVLVVIALVALLAITGLAIDGGRLYQARRQSQNGADAAALAATRIIASQRCSPSGGLDVQVRTAVLDYAQQNSVAHDDIDGRVWAWYVNKDSVQLAVVGGGSVPNGTTGVQVSTMITESTSFMRILGRDRMAAAGDATAMFGPVTSGRGFLPIAFPVQRAEDIQKNTPPNFTVFDATGAICRQEDVDCPTDPPAASQRGWLNFNYIYNNRIHLTAYDSPLNRVISTSASNAEQKDWAENGCPHPLFAGTRGGLPPYYTNEDFIVGNPGSRESSRSEVCSTWMGQTVYLPVFDYIYERPEMSTAFPGANEPNNPVQFPNAHFYHIVGFLAANLTECGSGNDKSITGTFVNAVIGEGPIAPGDGLQSGGGNCNPYALTAVVLWE